MQIAIGHRSDFLGATKSSQLLAEMIDACGLGLSTPTVYVSCSAKTRGSPDTRLARICCDGYRGAVAQSRCISRGRLVGRPGSLFLETISIAHAYGSRQVRTILREARLDLERRSVDLTPERLHRTIEVTEENQRQNPDMLGLASEIVAAYVSNNRVSPTELPGLIGTVHAALKGVASGTAVSGTSVPAEEIEKPTTAQIRKSIRPDGLVSFIDGKSYKTLKRHLTKHGLDPRSYRAKFGLPDDYPTTAASYSAARSALAKNIGLGRPGRMAA